jgi:ketosteroid isomerase-like protein
LAEDELLQGDNLQPSRHHPERIVGARDRTTLREPSRPGREAAWQTIQTWTDCAAGTRPTPQLSGDYNGPGEVPGYFERLPEIAAAFRFEVHDLLADDEHGVALLTGMAERSGERIEQKVVHVFHLDADGKVTEWWNFWEDQEALDDLLA